MKIYHAGLVLFVLGLALGGCGGSANKAPTKMTTPVAAKTTRTQLPDGVEVMNVALKLPNMACQNCAATIRKELETIAGVSEITTDPKTKLCTFKFINKEKVDLKSKLNELSKKSSELEDWSLIEG